MSKIFSNLVAIFKCFKCGCSDRLDLVAIICALSVMFQGNL